GGVGQHELEEADIAVLVDDVDVERRESEQHDGQAQLLRVHGSLLGVWFVHSSRSGPISASGRSSGKKSFASDTSIRRVTPGIVSRSQRAQRTSKKTSARPHTTSVGTRSRRSAGLTASGGQLSCVSQLVSVSVRSRSGCPAAKSCAIPPPLSLPTRSIGPRSSASQSWATMRACAVNETSWSGRISV